MNSDARKVILADSLIDSLRNPMKTRLPFKFILCLALPFFSGFGTAYGNGGEHSGGGGYRELQFKGIGYAIVDVLPGAKHVPRLLKRLDFKRLKKVIDETRVEATDELLRPSPQGKILPALIKDALNTPRKKVIQFNIDSWDALPDGGSRAALVLHEYLGIMGVDDSIYKYSHLINDVPALKFWFDNLEIAQSMTDSVPLDFPVECSSKYRDEKPLKLGFIGLEKPEFATEVRSQMIERTIFENPKNGELLVVSLTDTSNDDFQFANKILGKPKQKPGLRAVIGWTDTLFHEPAAPLMDQTLAIAPNLNFEMSLPSEGITLECHRVPIRVLKKPSDFNE
jgi:hypothetical protein